MTKTKQPSPAKQETNRDENGRFIPGVSGNPNGRPPKEHSLTDAVKAFFDANPDTKEELVKTVVTRAIRGDINAAKLVWEYMDGKATQRVESKDVTDEESEELKLLRDLITKHERTRKPVPAQRKTN
jgi:hypothetical protein